MALLLNASRCDKAWLKTTSNRVRGGKLGARAQTFDAGWNEYHVFSSSTGNGREGNYNDITGNRVGVASRFVSEYNNLPLFQQRVHILICFSAKNVCVFE